MQFRSSSVELSHHATETALYSIFLSFTGHTIIITVNGFFFIVNSFIRI